MTTLLIYAYMFLIAWAVYLSIFSKTKKEREEALFSILLPALNFGLSLLFVVLPVAVAAFTQKTFNLKIYFWIALFGGGILFANSLYNYCEKELKFPTQLNIFLAFMITNAALLVPLVLI